MSINELSAETTIIASPTKQLTDLQVVSLFVVVGLLLTAAFVGLGFGPDLAQAMTS
jgi:hypothetical protein